MSAGRFGVNLESGELMRMDSDGIWRDHHGKLITPSEEYSSLTGRQNVYLVDMSRDEARHLGTFKPVVPFNQNAVVMVEDLADYIFKTAESPLTASEDARLYANLPEYSCDDSFAPPMSWGAVKKYPHDFKVCRLTRNKGKWESMLTVNEEESKEVLKMPDPASMAKIFDYTAPKASMSPPPRLFPPAHSKADTIELPIELVSGLLMMLGGKVRLDWADLVAAEQVRDGREIIWSMSRDPANYKIYFKE